MTLVEIQNQKISNNQTSLEPTSLAADLGSRKKNRNQKACYLVPIRWEQPISLAAAHEMGKHEVCLRMAAAQEMGCTFQIFENVKQMISLTLPSILVPLVGLVFPAVAMASLFLYIEKEQLS
jgi:photosystem I subunit 8